MRYIKKYGLIASMIVLCLGMTAVSTSAQIRFGYGRGFYRPAIVSQYYWGDPFWYYGSGGPNWNLRSERYFDRKAVQTAKRRLQKDEDKFNARNILTAKEKRKLDSDKYKLERDRSRLRADS